ncbi:hypothetical protein [uncultured Aureimonas sp.]|uniref:hypothetical protein n=1 Tax=uncultured Aureimonas sp. TaxID=1604662 RepID=UPI0025CF8A11|nr:hypothetical protein [uncultured Aureimonas sp.]
MRQSPQPTRKITISVTEKVFGRLDTLAREANMQTGSYTGLLFDAAYAARVKGTPDAELDAQVALVGLATLSDADLEPLAAAVGLSIETATRMRDAWKGVLLERRRAG